MRLFFYSLLIFTATFSSVFAQESCKPLAPLKKAAQENGLKWVEVTPEQYHFLQGVYVLNPQTDKGLPFGDKAVFLQKPDDKGGVILWVDGDKVCRPMPLPPEVIELMMQIGQIKHEGQDN